MDIPVVELTELEKLEVTRVDAVGRPANGFPVLLMKGLAEPVEKDWADWDAAHEGGGKGKPSAVGDSKASAADAVARAKQTIADHKAGKKVSAADLKNAHEVHEAHLAHEAKLKADAEAKGKGKAAAKPAAKPKAKNPKAAKELAKMIIAAPHADPLLLLKAVSDDGEVDEEPDIDGGTKVLAMIADLIIAEAEELKAGQAGEICDILELACAAEKIWCWRTGEQAVAAGSVMPATTLMQSAAKQLGLDLDATDWPPAEIALFKARMEEVFKSKHSTDDRKKLAEQGNALSDGSYPIADEEDLKSAAILAQSGHGDVDGARRLIGRRSKELGVKNPLDDTGDTSKSQIAEGGTDVDTETQTGGLTKAVEEAIAKATAPLQERIATLDAELAKVKATPVPTGMVLSRNVQVKTPGGAGNEDLLAKAALYRAKADAATAPSDRDGYLALARETEKEARTARSE